jgi:hypothetical protein
MERSRGSVGQVPLDDYVEVVARIYSAHDKNRSIWDVWCHTLHHAAAIAEQIRTDPTGYGLHKEIADFSLWLFTAVLKLRGKFGKSDGGPEAPHDQFIRIQLSCSDLLWHSYPNLCPLCFGGNPPDSLSQHTEPENLTQCECQTSPRTIERANARRGRLGRLKIYSEQNRGKKPVSIDEWQELFHRIFASSISALSLAEMALRLLEALGLASDAMIRMYSYTQTDFVRDEPNWRQSSLEARLADTFSWLFLLVEKLRCIETNNKEPQDSHTGTTLDSYTRLAQIIWDRYGSEDSGGFQCSKCESQICRCEIILVPLTHSADRLLELYKSVVDQTNI